MDKKILNGYKCINKDFSNRYRTITYEIGKKYVVDGPLSFGNRGNGFHFTTYMEDCFRYFNNKESILCEVIGSGNILMFDDDYYGYYDMAVSSELEILRLISNEEILNNVLKMPVHRRIKFLATFELSVEDALFLEPHLTSREDLIYLQNQVNSKYYVKK